MVRPAIVAALLLTACSSDPDLPVAGHPFQAALTDVTVESGLDFRHRNGASGALYYPEIMGSGVALFDYDSDGDLDIYFVQSGALVNDTAAVAATQHEMQSRVTNRLYRNELIPDGVLVYTDVTDGSGVGDNGYGMGVAVGDIDADGAPDLYVTNFGSNKLYRNQGDGSFVDMTVQANADDPRWGTSASFADYDSDGDLDLYIANYTAFSVSNNRHCFHKDGRRDYCGPDIYDGVPDKLLLNDGAGVFTDVSLDAGIAGAMPGLGVCVIDLDEDGGRDFFVANDARANRLWHNVDGKFTDRGLDTGLSLNLDGRAEASMGIAAGDYDADGDEDLFLTHLATETNTLYQKSPGGFFFDVTDSAGLGLASLPYTGFGTGFFDLDNDGLLDLYIGNGAVVSVETRLNVSGYPYEQRNQLFINSGSGNFTELVPAHMPLLGQLAVSRGVAFGDLDNDGDTDIVVSNNNGAARLLRNDLGSQNAWIGLDLSTAGLTGNGATVIVLRSSGHESSQRMHWHRSRTDGSYLSSGDARVLVGLGGDDSRVDVVVAWAYHPAEVWPQLEPRQYFMPTPGAGMALSAYCASNDVSAKVCKLASSAQRPAPSLRMTARVLPE